ncbi:hypothetical protein ZMTM_01960 [Methyloradius palustris]|uniref:DUF3108 domain-containing protein n=2 Tax=Methyloradius palustris TaxID=2778876 RepID=A0A8D5JXP1_9PROT|nr:hypothetical protein ZMTM_01960 [Methyloradius palustris]
MLSNTFAKLRRFGSWRYVVALVLSVLLHFVLIAGASWHFPVSDTDDDTIEVALVPQQLVEKPAVKPVAVKPKAQSSKVPKPTPPTEAAPENKVADQVAVNAVDGITKQAEPTEASDASTEALPDQIAGQPEPLNEAAAWTPKSNFLEMEYDVFRGVGGMKIGVTRVNYKSGADGSYSLKSETEAKGLATLILSDNLVQVSEGLVTDKGLQPAEFSYQFARKSRQAKFDWQSALLTQQTNKEETTVPLPAGTQDILSFMFQFMFVPPLQEMELNITNGRKLNHYNYGFEGEETINSKLGDIRTLHISRTGQEDAKDDLWLAIDKEYLPIKIRKTEKDGSVIEQIVTRINTDITQ